MGVMSFPLIFGIAFSVEYKILSRGLNKAFGGKSENMFRQWGIEVTSFLARVRLFSANRESGLQFFG